ncbi:hypothetical protein H6P81_015177 [Aristolochia fimbriata]|uniref:Bidirectional sugar transporter SWEET n=1 Tax=Aristolochia fimbriata TaxID=158543 RepID=A0AAV7E7V3_ARIFI|nr:hypothetical protein H6P81_015177 [Aristolochia fimbriata]
MANISFIIGVVGNIVSILVFISPVGTFKRVVKKKSTENFKSIPYVATLLSTSLWTFYGVLKPGGLLVATVNGAGAVLQTIYVILFLIYAPKDTKIKTLKLVVAMDVAFLGAVVAVTLFVLHGSQRVLVVGFLCAGLTLGMYGSPMAAMRTVILTKSVEFMPFFLSFFLFLNGGVWTLYSVLVRDFFIGVPNAIGFVLGSVQLILYAAYRKEKPASAKQPSAEEEEEEEKGSAHLVEMGVYESSETQKEKSLTKGRSLPKPAVSRQLSLQRILKTYSLIPYDQIQTFARIVKRGSTEEFEGLPYVCTFLSSSLWTYYGVTKPGAYLIATVNSVGVLLELIYVTLFLIYAPPPSRARTGVFAAILDVGFLGAAVLVTRLAIHRTELRVTVIGLLCVGLTICMYGSPLAAMKTVITKRSVEYMPFFLSFFLFLNGGIWTFYSVLERDIFVGVPNGAGFVFGAAQLILYAIYKNAKGAKDYGNIEGLEEARRGLMQSSINEVNGEDGCSDKIAAP